MNPPLKSELSHFRKCCASDDVNQFLDQGMLFSYLMNCQILFLIKSNSSSELYSLRSLKALLLHLNDFVRYRLEYSPKIFRAQQYSKVRTFSDCIRNPDKRFSSKNSCKMQIIDSFDSLHVTNCRNITYKLCSWKLAINPTPY